MHLKAHSAYEFKSAKCKLPLKFIILRVDLLSTVVLFLVLLVASVHVHNCVKYEGSKLNHVDRRGT